ncbi:hypothetical protein IF2G_10762 [Cordyceps javanica]|nr:hypothetical protein IF2G_10762 [Cordyceps javanica]
MPSATFTHDLFVVSGCTAALLLANIALAMKACPPWHRGRVIRGATATLYLILLTVGTVLLAVDLVSVTRYQLCRGIITSCLAIPQVWAVHNIATFHRIWMAVAVGLIQLLWVVAGTVLWQSQVLSVSLGLGHLLFGLIVTDDYLLNWWDSNKTNNLITRRSTLSRACLHGVTGLSTINFSYNIC